MQKVIEISGIGPVQIIKRHGSRNIRLGFDSKGNVRISLPAWAPYESAVKFALSKVGWIKQHKPMPANELLDGARIGKAHTLRFVLDASSGKPKLRVSNNVIKVTYNSAAGLGSVEIQALADKGCRRALRNEGESLLPQRLNQLAVANGFDFKTVTVKQLKAKWGSCNHEKDIVLNFYLMQLPWVLIDYVLIHELVHTEYLNHSQSFWQRFESVLPNAKKIRKQLREYKTTVVSGPPLTED